MARSNTYQPMGRGRAMGGGKGGGVFSSYRPKYKSPGMLPQGAAPVDYSGLKAALPNIHGPLPPGIGPGPSTMEVPPTAGGAKPTPGAVPPVGATPAKDMSAVFGDARKKAEVGASNTIQQAAASGLSGPALAALGTNAMVGAGSAAAEGQALAEIGQSNVDKDRAIKQRQQDIGYEGMLTGFDLERQRMAEGQRRYDDESRRYEEGKKQDTEAAARAESDKWTQFYLNQRDNLHRQKVAAKRGSRVFGGGGGGRGGRGGRAGSGNAQQTGAWMGQPIYTANK